ncbi:LD-carboxypeptidase [Sphingobacterium sp. lm-10]|uniref:S66 peptidase family protein n=1 Tax=Sphingobacterium sp. lm-10 TaxID=2944904 RepID=UPI00202234F7|nr:LD-carboxypeptidase [Sphingobacterium sp. lm-10]MCL7988744.1 LD-carboxypeptidase [Sphingobacterium sp. lm-10]
MKTPPYLKKGDVVAIVATASAIRDGIANGIRTLEQWGLEVRVSHSVNATWNTFAGTDDIRREDLQTTLDDPIVKAVFAARGGYGTVRIIDGIDWTKFREFPKWVIGFSDITVLHSHIQRQTDMPSIHGQMPKTFEEGSAGSIASLRKALFGEEYSLEYSANNHHNRLGEANASLIGGNLAILQSIIASPSDPVYDGKILFLEDVGEALYNIDRMLWTLKRAGKLNKLRGLLVGGFTSLKESDPPYGHTVEAIIMEKVKEFDYPVAFDFPAGHISDNRALIFGRDAHLQVENNHVKLTYDL